MSSCVQRIERMQWCMVVPTRASSWQVENWLGVHQVGCASRGDLRYVPSSYVCLLRMVVPSSICRLNVYAPSVCMSLRVFLPSCVCPLRVDAHSVCMSSSLIAGRSHVTLDLQRTLVVYYCIEVLLTPNNFIHKAEVISIWAEKPEPTK